MKNERKVTVGSRKNLTMIGVLALGFVALGGLSGCNLFAEPTVRSPWSGSPATEADLVREAAAQAERIRAENERDTAAESARIDAAKRAFDAAVRTLDLETQSRIVALQEQHDATVAEAQAAVARHSAKLAEGARAVQAALERARGEIEREREKRALLTGAAEMVLGNPVVQGAAGAFPGGGLLLGLGGYAVAAMQAGARRKAENAAWDEASKAKETDALMAALLTRKTG